MYACLYVCMHVSVWILAEIPADYNCQRMRMYACTYVRTNVCMYAYMYVSSASA